MYFLFSPCDITLDISNQRTRFLCVEVIMILGNIYTPDYLCLVFSVRLFAAIDNVGDRLI